MSIDRSHDRALANALSGRRPAGRFPFGDNLVAEYPMRRARRESAVEEIEVHGVLGARAHDSILVLLTSERLVRRHEPRPDRNPLTSEHKHCRDTAAGSNAP